MTCSHARRLSVALAGAVLGCASSGADGIASQGVVNGTPEPGEPSAVMVVQQAAGSTRVRLCTGTVIGARAVLTAKHCVYRDVGTATWQSVPADELTVRMGPSFSASTRTVAATAVRTTAGAYVDGSGRMGDDIAVVLVGEDLSVPAIPYARTAPAMGTLVDLVGYGYTMAGAANPADLGTKHRGSATVNTVEASVFSTMGPTWTCTGDSGGPVLDRATGRLLGVTSIGPAGCRVSTSYATRVDRYVALIDDALGVLPPPDAGVAPDAGETDSGAGVPDARAADTATADGPGSDGGTGPGGSGCTCRAAPGAHGGSPMARLLAMLAAAFVARASRRARASTCGVPKRTMGTELSC